MDLLQVVRSFPQKRSWYLQLPAITAQRIRVEHDCDQVQFVVRGRAGKDEAGPNLPNIPCVNHPDLTGVRAWLWHPRLPGGQFPGMRPSEGRPPISSLPAQPPTQESGGRSPVVPTR